ncbi:transporter substrate-binding domain-containing protein [Pseudomonas fakonensis]|uniref:Transporter substrate-binding domain-containing protein n=1 Tax=Pseudomonas fakonensis TaxID=2842355 RepID=A0ABX8N1V7_9PSED|nr:transporter substrate-binding domain-containing protein [Pseudomonas fakonensis]
MIPLPRLNLPSFLLLLAASLVAGLIQAGEVVEVKVGAAHFPPYTVRPEQGADTGLLPQLAEALNRLQGQYHFVLVPTSIPRRFGDFQQGRTDLAIFENPLWGWQDIPHQSVDMGLEDAEVFVALAARGQHYFDSLEGKRLALFNGYHYAFAGFNADPAYLKQRYRATLTYSHDSNLSMVERGRADMALVTRSYLSDFLRRNPGSGQALMASQRVDQVYHHYALLRPGAPISPAAFAGLMRQLRENGELLRIFQPFRITVEAPQD